MKVCSNIRHPEAYMRETKYGNTCQDVLAVASANCVAECINPSIILKNIYEYSMGVASSLSSHLCICISAVFLQKHEDDIETMLLLPVRNVKQVTKMSKPQDRTLSLTFFPQRKLMGIRKGRERVFTCTASTGFDVLVRCLIFQPENSACKPSKVKNPR